MQRRWIYTQHVADGVGITTSVTNNAQLSEEQLARVNKSVEIGTFFVQTEIPRRSWALFKQSARTTRCDNSTYLVVRFSAQRDNHG